MCWRLSLRRSDLRFDLSDLLARLGQESISSLKLGFAWGVAGQPVLGGQ